MKAVWLAAAVCLISTPLVSAQTPQRTPLQIRPLPQQVIQLTSVVAGPSFELSTTNGTANGGTAGPSALQAFRLAFQNGDHKLKSLIVWRSGTASELRIGDNDGNDPFEGRARYLPLAQNATVQTVSAACLSYCVLPISPAAGQVFVLAGFSLQHGGSDVDVAQIGIVPHLDHGMIEVRYAPYALTNGGIIHRSTVSVQYALVPQAAVAFQTNCQMFQGCAVARGGEANVVLQGFHCSYDLRQAHLLVLGIDTRSAEGAEFQDNKNDDGGYCTMLIAGLR